MATIDLGKLGFVNKGTYNNSTTYEKNDLVQFTDSGILSTYLYIDSSAQSGQAPSSSGTAGSRWVFFAKGVADAVASAGNNKVLVTNASGNLTPLAIGSAGQVLKTNSGANGYEFGTITTKLLGHTIKVDQTGVNMGNINRATHIITQLNTQHTVISANSRFVINVKVHGGSPNHQKFWYQWSKDNSNWYHTSEAGNAGFTAVTLSGHGIDWSSELYHRYPQIGITTDADTNRHAPGTATSQLLPSGSSHTVGSTLYIRVGSFCSNDTSNMMYNRNAGNSGNDGTICQSSVEVFEYAL